MKKSYSLLALLMFIASASNPEPVSAECMYNDGVSVEMQLSPRNLPPSRTLSTITVQPSPGLVSSLSEIKVTFVGITDVTFTYESDDEKPYVISSGGTLYPSSNISIDGNTLVANFSPEITEEDIYMFTIPRKCCTLDGNKLMNDLAYYYYISQTGDNGIMYTAPEGETVKCQSDFLSYFVLEGGLSGMPLAGKPLHYVIGNDGNLYLYNIITVQPYGGSQTSSYIMGTPSGENKWKFSFPQPVYQTIVDGDPQLWYVNYLYKQVDASTGESTYQINESDNSVEFTIDANGNAVWIRESENPEEDDNFAIGATLPNGVWTGFANVIRSTYQKFTAEAPEINPQEFEIWKLTTGPNGNRTSRNVDVYFDGDDVWIRGFSKTYLPDAWAHGKINGKSITFDPYIGECDVIGQYLFLYGYTSTLGRTELKFKYYPAEKGMTYNGEYIINPNQQFYYAVEKYEYPSLEYVGQGSGIDDVEADKLVSIEWFSIEGVRLTAPVSGINIARKTYSSGKIEHTKILIK